MTCDMSRVTKSWDDLEPTGRLILREVLNSKVLRFLCNECQKVSIKGKTLRKNVKKLQSSLFSMSFEKKNWGVVTVRDRMGLPV